MNHPGARIETYYAIFLPANMPGSGTFAGGTPTEEVNRIEKVEEEINAVYLFTTEKKARVYRDLQLDDKWQVMPLAYSMCQRFLNEAKQFGYTHVSLDPGTVIITAQPIDLFLQSMPFRTFSDN